MLSCTSGSVVHPSSPPPYFEWTVQSRAHPFISTRGESRATPPIGGGGRTRTTKQWTRRKEDG